MILLDWNINVENMTGTNNCTSSSQYSFVFVLLELWAKKKYKNKLKPRDKINPP